MPKDPSQVSLAGQGKVRRQPLGLHLVIYGAGLAAGCGRWGLVWVVTESPAHRSEPGAS
jgi:hypothetical protein